MQTLWALVPSPPLLAQPGEPSGHRRSFRRPRPLPRRLRPVESDARSEPAEKGPTLAESNPTTDTVTAGDAPAADPPPPAQPGQNGNAAGRERPRQYR